jgi:imidazolonepropionase-like amidohydrolase
VIAPAALAVVLALVGGMVYPDPAASPIADGVVIVTDGVITAVGPRGSTRVPEGAQTIDCQGLFVTAGFQNSHAHFTEEKWIDAANQPAAALDAKLQAMLTRWGVTTVVDTASFLQNTITLRRRIESGEVKGPHILTAGLALYPPDGIPYYLRDVVPPELLKLLPQPSTDQEAIARVRENLGGGADLIKLFTGSWVARGRVLPMPVDVASAAVAESHRRGKLVFSHPSNVAGLEVALAAKVDVLAHAVENTSGLTADHFRRMKAQNMALVPTLTLFVGPDDRNNPDVVTEVGDYARLGGQILFGTDVGYLTDYGTAREYELMARAGLTWRQILAALTTNPAERFGAAARRGRLSQGLDGDVVVLGADPARDVRAFADVRHTIRGGQLLFTSGR